MSENMPDAQAAQSRAVVICASPRMASYLLCEALEATERFGVPREYFDHHEGKVKWWVDRLGIKGDEDYVDKVIAAGSTPNGVFGVKLFPYQAPDLVNRFLRMSGWLRIEGKRPTFVDCLRTRFDELQYIWMRRRNQVAQGISLYRASKSGVWHVRPESELPSPSSNEAAFEFAEIDSQVRSVEESDRQWQRFFALGGVLRGFRRQP
jgi:trehalose 2-sulfotransferase